MIELAEMKKEDIARCAEIYFTAFGYDKTFAKLDDIIESNRRLGKDVTCERDTRFLEMLRDGRI